MHLDKDVITPGDHSVQTVWGRLLLLLSMKVPGRRVNQFLKVLLFYRGGHDAQETLFSTYACIFPLDGTDAAHQCLRRARDTNHHHQYQTGKGWHLDRR